MSSKKNTLNTLLAGAVAATALGGIAVSPAEAGAGKGKEKCYGVVKAGKNGCGSADKAHGCAGQATVDGSGVEWIALAKGVCEKLAGGSLEPIMEKDTMDHDAEKPMEKAH